MEMHREREGGTEREGGREGGRERERKRENKRVRAHTNWMPVGSSRDNSLGPSTKEAGAGCSGSS